MKRVAFARHILNDYLHDVWTNKIVFYLDGISFVYKSNPMDQARAPHGRYGETEHAKDLSKDA